MVPSATRQKNHFLDGQKRTLKPFVQLTRKAETSPSCLHGNENVNPRGSFSRSFSPWSSMNLAKQAAIWSNNLKKSIINKFIY
jgi:hypothetical protein